MPMSFSLTQMLLISAAYLAALFAVAWISERGMIPRAIIRHPLTYTLSLGVYWHRGPGLSVRLRLPVQLPWGVRRIPAGAGVAVPDPENHPHLPAVIPGGPVCLPFSQHLGWRADHDFHVARRIAAAGPADPGRGGFHQHPHP